MILIAREARDFPPGAGSVLDDVPLGPTLRVLREVALITSLHLPYVVTIIVFIHMSMLLFHILIMYWKRDKCMLRLRVEGILSPYVLRAIVVIFINWLLLRMYCLGRGGSGHRYNIRLKILRLFVE
jgi:hypothetical protein